MSGDYGLNMSTPTLDVDVNAPLPEHLVLFDGVCAVCDAAVQWILDHDPEGVFHFAPLQGPTAAAILARHPELPRGLDSIVLVEQTDDGEQLSVHSAAILGIGAALPPPWSAARFLRWLPRLLRDPVYRAFAAVRYRIFGKLEACRLPTEDQAARFLD